MKLHLPKSLRSALMACCSVALTLAPTLATGAISGGAVTLMFASSSTANAAPLTQADVTYTFTSGSNVQDAEGGVLTSVADGTQSTWATLAAPEEQVLGITAANISGWIAAPRSIAGMFTNGFNYVCGNTSTGRPINIGAKGLTATNDGNITIAQASLSASQEWYADANCTITIGTGYTEAWNGLTGNAHDLLLGGGGSFSFTNQASRGLTVALGALTVQDDSLVEFNNNISASSITITGEGTNVSVVGTTTLTGAINNAANLLLTGALTTTGAITNTGWLALDGGVSGATSMSNTGFLTLGGTVNFAATGITGDGEVGLRAGTIFNVANLTPSVTTEGSVTTTTYTLLVGGRFTNETSLEITAARIEGIITAGYTWSLTADGKLIGVKSGSDMEFLGGTLTWDKVNPDFEGGAIFKDGDTVIFKTADAFVTLEEAIAPVLVVIESGIDVSMTGAGNQMSDAEISISANASMTITDAVLADNVRVTAADASSNFKVAIGAADSILLTNQLSEYTGTVTVASGRLEAFYNTLTTPAAFVVEDGGQLWLAGATRSTAITLYGDGYAGENGQGALRVNGPDSNLTYSGTITAYDSSMANYRGTNTCTISGTLAGSGTLNTYGTGTFAVTGNMTHTGSLVINGGMFSYGTGDAQTNSMSFKDIQVNAGATFRYNHASANFATDILLNGGTLQSFDMNSNTGSSFKDLILMDDSSIFFQYNGGFTFNSLSGTGDIAITKAAGNTEYHHLSLNVITDYHGTITIGMTDANDHFFLNGPVTQSAGMVATITGATVKTIDFTKLGEGSLTIDSLSVSNILNMNYEGSLTLTSISIADNATLVYNTAEGVVGAGLIGLNKDFFAGNINLSVFGMDESAFGDGGTGVNLGVSTTDLTLDAFKALIASVAGVNDYDIIIKNGTYWLTSDNPILNIWDTNWGSVEIATQPLVLNTKDDVNGTFSLFDRADTTGAANDFDDGTRTSINLTGGGSNSSVVIGGYNSATSIGSITRDSWINMEDGTFHLLVGGNQCDNWGSGAAANFTGDSHIQVKGGSVNYIIGANYKDGQSARFIGDTYISIYSDSVKGSVIGGGAVTHQVTNNFQGNSNIYVYAPLTSNSGGALNSATPNAIVGSSIWAHNAAHAGQSLIHVGNANITIELKDSAEDATFVKRIIGGMVTGSSYGGTLTGSSYINISNDNSTGQITFNEIVVGGHWASGSGALTTTGSSNVTISNADNFTFTQFVCGGSYTSNTSAAITMGDGTNVAIDSGSFTNYVVLGGRASANTYTVNGVSSMQLSGGSFAGDVIGGVYDNSGATNITYGDAVINITGSTKITGNIYGGNFDTGTGDIAQSWANGDISITIDGDDVEVGTIYGGGRIRRTAGVLAGTVGDVDIKLASGKLTGNVYAGGAQTGTSFIEVASTSVSVGSEMSINAGVTISGGFHNDGGAGTCVVTGDKTLIFDSIDSNYGNLGNTQFRDFNVIEVTELSSYVTLGAGNDLASIGASIEKTGAGTLILGAANAGGVLNVSAGTVKLAANSSADTLTSVTVGSGATLDMTAAATGIGGSLTMQTDSILAVTNTGDGSVVGSLTMGGKIDIAVTGELTGFYSVELFKGLDLADISGIILEELMTGQMGISANAALNGVTVDGVAFGTDDAYLILLDDGTLVLTNMVSNDYFWEGGNGNWSANNMWAITDEGTANMAFADTVNVHFTNAADAPNNQDPCDIVVSEDVIVNNFLVSEGTYNFNNAAGTITIAGNISVAENGNLSFSNGDKLAVSKSKLSIDETSSVTVAAGGLSIDSLESSGELTVTGDLAIAKAVTTGGDVDVTGNVSLGADTDNSFNSLDASGTVTSSGKLSLAGDSTLGALSGGSLDVTTADQTVTINSSTSLDSISGAGNLNVQGNLSLAEASSIGDLTVNGSLTLGATLDVDGALSADSVEITSIGTINEVDSSNLITAVSLTSLEMDFILDGALLATGDGEGEYTLITLESKLDEGSFTGLINGEASVIVEDFYVCKVELSSDGKSIVITKAASTDMGWRSTDGTWGTDTDDWGQGLLPGPGQAAGFLGGGTEEVVIVGDKNVQGILVDARSGKTDYTFTGEGGIDTGYLTIAHGSLTIENAGGVNVTGDTNIAANGKLTVAEEGSLSAVDINLADNGAELINNGSLVSTGTITIGEDSFLHNSASLEANIIAVDGLLTNTAELEANEIIIDGKLVNTGTIDVGSILLDGLLHNNGGTVNVEQLNGTGSIEGTINITGTGGDFAGDFNKAIIVSQAGANQQLTGNMAGLTLTGSAGSLSLDMTDSKLEAIITTGANIIFENGGADGAVTAIELGSESSMTGGSLTFNVNAAHVAQNVGTANGQVITTGKALHLTDVNIIITQADINTGDVSINSSGGFTDVVLCTISDVAGSTVTGGSITLDGYTLNKYFTNARLVEGSITVIVDINNHHYTDRGLTANGIAGSILLDDMLILHDPQRNKDTYADTAGVLDAMDDFLQLGNRAAADKLASAAGGASVTALGSALMNDVERQLKMIRNRTMSMGVNPNVINQDMPYYNAWINAEGNRSTLDADSTMAGYTLNSWGGSFGLDVDMNENLTMGGAFTAMYGKLSVDGADSSSGHLDTYYASLFARVAHKSWTHSFVMTAGMADAELTRNVVHHQGQYTTKGTTDGYALGLMYELGYTIALNEEGTACWQPVVNLAFAHSSLKGYTEKGSDASVTVGDQTNTYVTVGVGGRAEFAVGENLYNRTSILSMRAMAKFDLGSRQSEADVYIDKKGRTTTMKGSEVGAVGLELGAGLLIPVTDTTGAIFIDASLEVRDNMNSVNGTVGYRFSF